MKEKFFSALLYLLVLVPLSIWQQGPYMDLFPAQHHSWTQSDRFAIALQFSSETSNLFKPKTFNLKPENYTGEGAQVMDGTSAMDLPLFEYVVGMYMRASGNRSPAVFRWSMWLLSVLALYFLFRLPVLFGYSILHGFALVLMFYLSPVYHHYMVGFAPSVVALSLCIVGVYFMAKHSLDTGNRHFYVALIAFALAAWIRLPFTVLLIAMLLASILIGPQGRKSMRIVVRPIVIVLLGIALFWLYNQYLRSVYGSMFLGSLLLPETWAEAKYWIKQAIDNWGNDYLHWTAYVFLAVVSLGALLGRRKALVKRERNFFALWFLIALLGSGCFALLMLGQFPNHDYYGIDTFFPLILLVLLWAYHRSMPNKIGNWVVPGMAIVAFGLFALPHLTERQEQRYFIEAWDLNHVTYENFKESEAFLDHQGIAKDARMLVIDAFTTNIPLIEMNRSGYTVLTTSETLMKEALQWPLDYVALQDTFTIPEVVMNYREIVEQLSFVCGNGSISVYELKKPETEKEAICKVLYHGKRTYENDAPDTCWSNGQVVQQEWVHSGSSAGFLSKEAAFSQSLNIYPKLVADSLKPSTLVLTGYFKMDSVCNEVSAVVSVTNGDSLIHYDRQYFVYRIHGKEELERAVFHFPLPALTQKQDQLKCYFWKEGEQNFYFDDLEAMLYQ